jgi:1,3-beta-glucanosyltransferase GAS3
VTRDLKNYIKKNSPRAIPVGYSAADVRNILVDTWNYLQCTTTGDDSDPSRVDLFALNSYSWCGDSSFTTSSYNVLISDLTGTSVPVFFSEYGCNVPAPRVFTEVPVIYGPLMTPVLSGGMVYEFSQEVSNFGLVNINSDGSANLLPDFNTLQKQFSTLNVTALQGLPAQNTSVVPPKCSSSLISASTFDSNFTLPAVPPGAQALIDNGISNAPVGKIVPVTKTAVSQTVKDTSGNVIQGLAIIPLSNDQSNNPGSVQSTSASATNSATTAATTKKASAASSMQRNWTGLAIAGVIITSWLSLM